MKLGELQFPFWIASGRPGASREVLLRAEGVLGRRLPLEFARALELQDGQEFEEAEVELVAGSFEAFLEGLVES